MEPLAERAKRLRTELGLTQQQVAARAGVSQVTISDIERGRNKGTRELIDLAKALNTTPTYLSTGKDTILQSTVAVKSGMAHALSQSNIRIELFDGEAMSETVSVRAMDVSPAWVRENLAGANDHSSIMLITCDDDSMEGTFKRGDVIVIDTSIKTVSTDGIYAFAIKEDHFLKRLQRLSDGGLRVISDNAEHYPPHKLTALERTRMHVKGRALYRWSGGRL